MHRPRIRLILSCMLLITGVPILSARPQAGDNTAEAKKHYQNAVAAIAKSDWQTATTELLQAEKLAPQNALVRYDLALAYSHTGQIKSAQKELTNALQIGLPAEQKQAALKLKQQLMTPAVQKTDDVVSTASRSEAEQSATQGSTAPPTEHSSSISLEDTVNYINKILNDNPTLRYKASGCEAPQFHINANEEDGDIEVYEKTVWADGECRDHNTLHVPSYMLETDNSTSNPVSTRKGPITVVLSEGPVVELICKKELHCIRGNTGDSFYGEIPASLNDGQLARLERAFLHLIDLMTKEHNEKGLSPNDPFAH